MQYVPYVHELQIETVFRIVDDLRDLEKFILWRPL